MEQISPHTLQALSLKGIILIEEDGVSRDRQNVHLKLVRKNPAPIRLPQSTQYAQGSQDTQGARNADAQDTENLPNIVPGMTLALKIGEQLGRGSSGAVYDVFPDTEDGFTSTALLESTIPPLVVKIALRKHEKDIHHEASFYNHLKSLQGSVIPRCYGYFTTTDHEIEAVDSNSGAQGPGSTEDSKPVIHLLVLEKLSEERLPVSEKLSEEHLPVSESLTYQDTICQDTPLEEEICDLFRELSVLSVRHGDVRWDNIAKVLPGAELSATPTTKRTSQSLR